MKRYTTLIFGVFLTIAPLISSSFITILALNQAENISKYDAKTWFLLSIVFVFSSAFALTPPTFLALIFGYFLGINAVFLLLPINLLAISLVFFSIQFLDKNNIKAFLSRHEKSKKLLETLQNDGWKVVFFTKLSPVLPFALTNFAFSVSGLSLKNILFGGFLGMIPRTILAVWAGSKAQELQNLLENPNQDKFVQWGICILLLVSIWGIWHFVQKSKAN